MIFKSLTTPFVFHLSFLYTCQLRVLTPGFSLALLDTTLIPLAMSDARSTDRIGNYTKFWDKDREGEKAEVQDARVDNYSEVVNGW